MNLYILSLILQFSNLHHIDPTVVEAIIEVESGYKVSAVGSQGEIGLMQLMPANFKHISKLKLFKPELNISLGVLLLDRSRQECIHKKDLTWVVCYNLGSPRARKVKNPKLFPYYKKILFAMGKISSTRKNITWNLRTQGYHFETGSIAFRENGAWVENEKRKVA